MRHYSRRRWNYAVFVGCTYVSDDRNILFCEEKACSRLEISSSLSESVRESRLLGVSVSWEKRGYDMSVKIARDACGGCEGEAVVTAGEDGIEHVTACSVAHECAHRTTVDSRGSTHS